jgi:hypothetical protein
MTKDEIIEMAKDIANTFGTRMCDENGDTHGEELYAMCIDDIVDTIKLVAEKEREACARELDFPFYGEGGKECAAAIRARGQA